MYKAPCWGWGYELNKRAEPSACFHRIYDPLLCWWRWKQTTVKEANQYGNWGAVTRNTEDINKGIR